MPERRTMNEKKIYSKNSKLFQLKMITNTIPYHISIHRKAAIEKRRIWEGYNVYIECILMETWHDSFKRNNKHPTNKSWMKTFVEKSRAVSRQSFKSTLI